MLIGEWSSGFNYNASVPRTCLAAALLAVFAVSAQDIREIHRLGAEAGAGGIAGAALTGSTQAVGRIVTWGRRVVSWPLDRSSPRVLVRDAGSRVFGEGGAVFDMNGDGQPDIVLTETSPAQTFPSKTLVWFEAPRGRRPNWTRHVMETGIDAHEILGATLFGRRGALLIQRRNQVRFYTADGGKRDIYSFYTPSDQGGLALHDVDGDGRPDIIAGNYWIQAPESYELPWRLFAINTWSEEKLSAMSALAVAGPGLMIAQAERTGARLAWFEKPADPRQLWRATRLEGSLDLEEPHSVAIAGDTAYVAERAGLGRLIAFRNFTPTIVAPGIFARFAWMDRSGLVLLTKDAILRVAPGAKNSP